MTEVSPIINYITIKQYGQQNWNIENILIRVRASESNALQSSP